MKTQRINHPNARLFCTPIEDLIPTEAVPGHVDMIIAAPECTHFSRAAGGVPKNDQSRSKAQYVLDWLREKLPTYFVCENVPEFVTWGPTENGKVVKTRKGETFNTWIDAIERMGYTIRWQVLNAADFGVPQTRKRFILIAKRNASLVPYPSPTHAKAPTENDTRLPWDCAANHIDLGIKSQSIYTRKKPLALATLRRIEVGLQKYGGLAGDPFLVILRHYMTDQSLLEPFKTVTAGGGHFGLVQPFLTKFHGGEGARAERVQSIDDPFLTLDTQNRFGLAQPCLIRYNNNGDALPLNGPFGTLTTKDRFGLAQPMLLPHRKFNIDGADSIFDPFRTLDATNCRCNALAIPKFIQVEGELYFPDIHFRMLVKKELAAAQSFPPGYGFEGTAEDITKQIGNAIPPGLAKQISLTIVSDWRDELRLAA